MNSNGASSVASSKEKPRKRGDLEYADQSTFSLALVGRQDMG